MSLKPRRTIMSWARRVAAIGAAILGWTFASNPTGHLYAQTQESITVTFTPRDIYPPTPITDLTATPGAANQMLLQWSAPNENNAGIIRPAPATSYTVKIATFSVDMVGSTTAWWNSAQDVPGEPIPGNPGIAEFLLINSLTGGVTYYASIKSTDDQGLVSLIDVKSGLPGQQAKAFIFQSGAPPTPVNFFGTALSSASIQWTWTPSLGATFYNLLNFPSGVLVQQTTFSFITEIGFIPNQAVSRTLTAGNALGTSAQAGPVTVYSLAVPPQNIAFSSVVFNSISLQWTSGGNPAGTQFQLQRSLNGVSFTSIATVSTTNFQNTGLTPQTTYFYRVLAINGDGILSAPSNVINIVTPLPTDLIAPDQPLGLKGIIDPTGRAFTLIWEPVTQNVDGSPTNDLAGYFIYKRTTISGVPVRLTPTPINVNAYADIVNGQTFYYTVRAVDTTGNESPESMLADSSSKANIIYIGPDNLSTVAMPESVNDLLRSNYNSYGIALGITMTEMPAPANTNVIRSVVFNIVRGDTKEIINDLAFQVPDVVVGIAYNLIGGQVGRGSPLSLNAQPSALAGTTPQDLSFYWFNGVTWVKIGGTLDEANQVLKTKTSFLGNYQIRISKRATSLTLNEGNVYPRVFTPNNDGFNDRVYFVLENPNDAVVRGEIFDLQGRLVKVLNPPSTVLGVGTTLIWDGKDQNNAVVPSGAYMYRITGEGNTFTGTVAVAR